VSDDYLRSLFESADPARHLSNDTLDNLLSTDELVERSLVESARYKWRSSRKWRRAGIFTLSLALVAGGSAAAVAFLREPVQNTTELTCFASTSQGSNATVVSLTAHPLRTCRVIMHWDAQSKGSHFHGALCVLSNGSIGGYPPDSNPNECEDLGLATYNGRAKDSRAAAFQVAAQNYFAAHQCQSLLVAQEVTFRLLKHYGVTDWNVHVSGSRAPGSCATLAVQARNRKIDIVGINF
jgi:hypothetical protein